MRLTQSLFFIVTAALALAVGASYAADEHIGKDKTKGDPGFNALDKNGDGKISRMEYLEAMSVQDATHAKDKAENAIDKHKDKPASTGSTTSK